MGLSGPSSGTDWLNEPSTSDKVVFLRGFPLSFEVIFFKVTFHLEPTFQLSANLAQSSLCARNPGVPLREAFQSKKRGNSGNIIVSDN